MKKSNNCGTIKLSLTVQAALKPHRVPVSYSKEDLWLLAKTCVTTLICKTLLSFRQSGSAPGFTGGLQLTLPWFYIFMFITAHYEDGK